MLGRLGILRNESARRGAYQNPEPAQTQWLSIAEAMRGILPPTRLELGVPGDCDRLEGIGGITALRDLLLFARARRVNAIGQLLANLGAPFTRGGQADIGIHAQGEQALLAHPLIALAPPAAALIAAGRQLQEQAKLIKELAPLTGFDGRFHRPADAGIGQSRHVG
jgi:hypothetical protein